MQRWRPRLAALLGDERTPRIGFVLAAVAAFALLIYLGRSLTFYNDEWTFIVERRDLSLDDLMRPHNEHWSLFLALGYGIMFWLFGLASYLPYLAVLLALHVLVALGVFRLVEREAGGWVALGLATLMLFLGSGHQNLFWAFQVGFVGATAAGIWALVALRAQDPGRRSRSGAPLAAILLTVAVATQGIGLFFLVAVATLIVADGTWRRRWPAVVVPAVAYVTWFVLLGRGEIAHHRDPFTPDALASVPAYLLRGLEWSVGAVIGWGPDVGRVLVVLAAAAIGWTVIRGGRPSPLILAACAGVVAQYAVTGLVRAQLGTDQATEARYTYVAAAFMLPAVGAALGRALDIALGAGETGDRDAAERAPRRAVRDARWRLATLVPLLAFALLANGYSLRPGKATFQERADFTRAYVEVIGAHADAPAVLDSQGIFPYPRPTEMLRLAAAHGSPLSDRWVPSVVRPTTPELRDQALTGMLAAGIEIEQRQAPIGGPIGMLGTQHVAWMAHGTACAQVDAIGSAPSVTLRLEAADDLAVQAGAGGTLSVALGLEAAPGAALATADTEAGESYVIRLPDLEPGTRWTVRLDLPGVRGPVTTVCSADPAD
jgi:hypothetical protein